MPRWFVITPEYPPRPGGVSDYTRTLARALGESGDVVDVWAPSPPRPVATSDAGVTFHPLPDRFGLRSRQVLDQALASTDVNTVVLVQYVPHGFGMRAMNLPFAWWLGRRRERLWLMVHEAVYPFVPGQPLKHHVLAAATRIMLAAATARAERVFVSTPAWQPFLERYGRSKGPVEWLSIPATVPSAFDTQKVGAIRRELALAPAQPLIGHFGTYGAPIAEPLRQTVNVLRARHPDWAWLMLGRNAATFARTLHSANDSTQLFTRENLTPEDLSNHLRALDVTLLPFPDGISTRRTSAMAALAVGSATVSTAGASTEALWSQSGALALAACDPLELAATTEALVQNEKRRAELRERSRELYAGRFDVRHVVSRLREAT